MLTNANKIRDMTDEALAELLTYQSKEIFWDEDENLDGEMTCDYREETIYVSPYGTKWYYKDEAVNETLKWLRELTH